MENDNRPTLRKSDAAIFKAVMRMVREKLSYIEGAFSVPKRRKRRARKQKKATKKEAKE